MAKTSALERLPMTMGYFRLFLRCYGGTPAKRAALLAGTGVSERGLRSPSAEISLFQQVKQIENITALYGEGWALDRSEIWNPPAQGPVGIAVLAAPTLGAGVEVLKRYAHVRAPFYRARTTQTRRNMKFSLELSVALRDDQWRPMVEITFMALRSLLAAVLGHPADDAHIAFAGPAPSYADKIRHAFGAHVSFGADENSMAFPAAWLVMQPPFSDPALFQSVLAELRQAVARIENPDTLRARVERLLHTMPDGRLDADSAARAIGVSRRTLVRRLGQTDTRFRDLLDDEMKRRASKFLQTRTLSRDEVAERLGYRDPTSFSRACRRWFKDARRKV